MSFRCRRNLPRLLPNEGAYPVLKDGQRHRTQRQYRIVEAPLVELRPERRFGFAPQPQNRQLTQLVGERLSWPADITIDLGFDLMLGQRCMVR